jgi:hypothetical protein
MWLKKNMEHWWNGTERGKLKYTTRQKPIQVLPRPPQISHGLNWDRTRFSVMKGWRLTACAMAQPKLTSTSIMQRKGSARTAQ